MMFIIICRGLGFVILRYKKKTKVNVKNIVQVVKYTKKVFRHCKISVVDKNIVKFAFIIKLVF